MRGVALVGIRPEPHGRLRSARFAEPGFRECDDRLFLAAMREPYHGLAERDHLARLRQRCRDVAVGISLQLGIIQLIAREVERTPRALEATFRLVLRRTLALEIGGRSIAARFQRVVAVE